jgi:hypothetical protein
MKVMKLMNKHVSKWENPVDCLTIYNPLKEEDGHILSNGVAVFNPVIT